MPTSDKIPAYKPGRQAGYDLVRRRYYTKDGQQISKAQFDSGLSTSVFGGWLPAVNHAPQTTLLTKLERIVARAERGEDLTKDPLLDKLGGRFNAIMSAVKPMVREQTRPIPADVRASMRLADYYPRAFGDIDRHIVAPIMIAAGGKLKVRSPDPGFKKFIQDEYDRLDMWTILWRNWMGAAQFGISFPYEVWDDKGRLLNVIDLPPTYVWVGYMIPFGLAPVTKITDKSEENVNYALLPFDDSDKWTKELAQASMMPMTFNSGGTPQNMNLPWGWNIPLLNQNLQPVRAMSYGYERYPVVPISRAFTAMGTRAVFDETVRGTIEGRQNELWVFTLGTEKAMPKGDELIALQAALAGMAGERTGRLLWRHGLEVNLYAPTEMQNMLAAETRQAFTLEIFRQMGGNIRIETGNPLIGQRETAADKVDLAMWLRTLEWPRNQNLLWEAYIREKIAASQGKAALDANEKTTVAWARSTLENSSVIEDEIKPMYQLGGYSMRTALERVGESYEEELANKEQEEKNARLFSPPATFTQTTLGPGGAATTTQTPSPGRPPGVTASLDLDAIWADETERVALMQAVAEVATSLASEGKPATSIAALKGLTTQHLATVTQAAYLATGGSCELLPDELDYSARFVNSFADRFQADLEGALAEGADLAAYGSRAMLYATEGFKMAAVNGQRLAMRERGAASWSRVAGETSCAACRADALTAHGINEPFNLMHVAEALEEEALAIRYHTGGGISSVHVPVPSYTNQAIEVLKTVSGSKTQRTRRARD